MLNLVFRSEPAPKYRVKPLKAQRSQRLQSVLLHSVFCPSPIPAAMAFRAMAHSRRFRSIAQATSLDLVMSPLTSKLEAEQPPLQ